MGLPWRCMWDSFIAERIQPQLLQQRLIGSVEQGLFLYTCVVQLFASASLNCEVTGWWVHIRFSACVASVLQGNDFWACAYVGNNHFFHILGSQLNSSSCCGRCICVTP